MSSKRSRTQGRRKTPGKKAVEAFTTELTEKARRGSWTRSSEGRTSSSAPCRCSAAGSRTTRSTWATPAWARPPSPRGLRSSSRAARCPRPLKDAKIFSLDMGSLIAGTQVPGRLRGADEKGHSGAPEDGQRHPLHRRDPHRRGGRGRVRRLHGRVEHAEAAAVASGRCKCIGSTTYEEYKKYFDKDRALSRRFQKIEIPEPTIEETHEILRGLRDRYESYHNVTYTDEALRAAVGALGEVHQRPPSSRQGHRRDRRGRGLHAHVPRERRRRDRHHGPTTWRRSWRRSPRSRKRASPLRKSSRLKDIEVELKKQIFGQDGAIEHVCRGHQAEPGRLRQPGPAHRVVPVRGTHGRGQDRAGAPARRIPGREAPPLRHERVPGKAHGGAAHRRASGLRGVRGGRPPHRGDPENALRGASPRRDRKGAPGHLQHAAPGHGLRHADGQHRQEGGFPQRHHHHDLQRRARGRSARRRWASRSAR